MTAISLEPKTHQTTAIPTRLQTSLRRIVLTGFMGAGKSTIGRLLADRLAWSFVDVDTVIEHEAGTSVASIFADQGESAFRALESRAIARALGQENTVTALGGGAPEILTNRLLLEQTPNTVVIFLNAPFATLFGRCISQDNAALRPVLMNPEEAARRFQQRTPFYRRSAQLSIDTENQMPSQTLNAILNHLFAKL